MTKLTEKQAITEEYLNEDITGRRTRSVNSLHGSYLMLVDIRDLLIEQNRILRESAGLPAMQDDRIKAEKTVKDKRTFWRLFKK